MQGTPNDVTAVLGLSIEPLTQIQSQMTALPSALVKPGVDMSKDPTALAERIAKHLFNYVSGFVGGGGGITLESTVLMSIITKWHDNFTSKVRSGGIGFLERTD
jgi:hypothetical protein